jgi:oxalate decarboxylase
VTVNRRKVLGGAGLAGAAAATGVGVDRLIISSGTGYGTEKKEPMTDDAAFEQHVGDIVFAPQGSFHYFENRGPDDMAITIIQNTSAPEDKDNIGIGESVSRLPPRVLSAVFGVPEETFSSFKKIDSAIVILRSP